MTCEELLRKLLETCPVCHGKGEVKKWEAVDPETKQPTGLFKGMKPCPYCGKARKVLGKFIKNYESTTQWESQKLANLIDEAQALLSSIPAGEWVSVRREALRIVLSTSPDAYANPEWSFDKIREYLLAIKHLKAALGTGGEEIMRVTTAKEHNKLCASEDHPDLVVVRREIILKATELAWDFGDFDLARILEAALGTGGEK